jgi:putative ABC transport system ATP-binding protein
LLSGGQRQALTLLMTVLSKPQMLLLDEHTAALDPRNAQIVMDLTTKFIKEYNLTSLMVTHNMQHAIDFGNRLIMMDEGKIILDLSEEEKQSLTVAKLVQKFKNIKKRDYASDEDLLVT